MRCHHLLPAQCAKGSGPSSERCRAGEIASPAPQSSPLWGFPEQATAPAYLHLLNHLKQICVLQEEGREQVSPQGGPANPAEPPRSLHPTQPSWYPQF